MRRLGVLLIAMSVLLSAGAAAANIDLAPPGERDFILDRAGLIEPADAAQIRTICGDLLGAPDGRAVPLIVVTVPSLAEVGGGGMSIEQFATALFNQWGIGYERLSLDGQEVSWNYGILLLVSKGDRKARIEVGADWGPEWNAACQEIMDDHIIPSFKQGAFSQGILRGVVALDAMARGLELPSPKRPTWHTIAIALAVALGLFTLVSLIRRGSGGWAWLFWAGVFTVVVFLVSAFTSSSSSSSSGGGGFSGGSFGGGSSSGGGATGSW